MKKLHAVFGLMMGTALVSGCTNTAREVHYFPSPVVEPAPIPTDLVEPPAPAPEPTPDPTPDPMPEPPAPVATPEDPSIFPMYKEIIQASAPEVSQGSASAIRFMNYTTGKRYTTMITSDSGVVPLTDVPNAGLTFMVNDSGERMAIAIGSLKPGHYDCATSNFAVGFAFPGEAIDGEEASWSDRPGATCEFDIWEGDNAGDIQGKFSGTLATLEGHTLSIADGYFYARNPKVTPAPVQQWGAASPAWSKPAPHTYHR